MINRRFFLKRAGIGAGALAIGGGAVAVAKAQITPDERIAAAMEEIKDAFAEKYPGWRIQEQNVAQKPLTMVGKELVELDEPMRHAVLMYATADKYGPEEARWFVHHHFED